MKKRFICIFLSLCLLLAFAPAVYAAGNEFTVDNLRYRITDETNNYVEVASVASVPADGAITIPDTVRHNETSYTVVGLGGNSIGGNLAASITSVSMPENSEKFTYIADAAFQGCTQITTLTIPASVTKIGFISSYDNIGGFGAFDEMTNLTSVTFAEGSKLKILGSNTFSGCTALTTLTLPSSLKEVGSAVIEGCTGLPTLTIPASVDKMSSLAFGGYYESSDGTPNVRIESGSKYQLKDGILYDDTTLLKAYEYRETVVVPEGITTIKENAFASNQTANSITKSLTLPNSLCEIGNSAFIGCTALETVDFQNNTALTEIPSMAFAACSSLKKITVPEGVTSIGYAAFYGCTGIETIELPEGLETIGDMAFALIDIGRFEDEYIPVNENPQLESINIPSNVTSVGELFLAGVKPDGGTKLIFEGDTPPEFAENAFACITGEYDSPTIYYPEGATDQYTGERNPFAGNDFVMKPSEPETPDNPENPERPPILIPPFPSVLPTMPGLPFTDVADDAWYYDAVEYVYDEGLMNGVGGNKFNPTGDMTRGMVATILYRMEGEPRVASDGAFWWSDARVWAMEAGVSDGTNMDGKITREQLAAMLFRYAKTIGADVSARGNLNRFSDAANVSGWAADAMQWAVGEGVIAGSNGKLNPKGLATRAEVATMFMRFDKTFG